MCSVDSLLGWMVKVSICNFDLHLANCIIYSSFALKWIVSRVQQKLKWLKPNSRSCMLYSADLRFWRAWFHIYNADHKEAQARIQPQLESPTNISLSHSTHRLKSWKYGYTLAFSCSLHNFSSEMVFYHRKWWHVVSLIPRSNRSPKNVRAGNDSSQALLSKH